jgi:hypothetical protein
MASLPGPAATPSQNPAPSIPPSTLGWKLEKPIEIDHLHVGIGRLAARGATQKPRTGPQPRCRDDVRILCEFRRVEIQASRVAVSKGRAHPSAAAMASPG